MPERNVGAEEIFAASILVNITIAAAAANITILWSLRYDRPSAGFSIRPTELEIAAA